MSLPKLRKEDVIEVHWIDITTTASWKTIEEAENYIPTSCYSVGYFLNEDKDVIRLSATKNDEGERDVNVIIKGCIQSIGKLKR